ncbi:hypothetical protein, conserved [Plasmodium gonderi]|uniref:Uncharacterized protein n=1 Tax=Plasmodium gonderi TaxID=77519 RepID=A0A1Y1JMA1_PLAGO|nr:hypothetical protein, conserved [Plasmodium gonderi]GAW83360.1 hypothetical protein, conserved [Plasmodium gonderi]
MENYSYSSGSRKMILPEQSHSNVENKNTKKKCDSINLHDPKEHVAYSLYDRPGGINLMDQNGYLIDDVSCYKPGDINASSTNLYNRGGMYIDANNDNGIIINPNRTFNMGAITPGGSENYDYINSSINLNQGNYYNPYEISKNFVSSSENLKYELNNEIDRAQVIPKITTKLNNSYMTNVSNTSNINKEILNNESINYIDPDSYTNLYGHLSDNNIGMVNGIASKSYRGNIASATNSKDMSNIKYDLIMQNYRASLCNNVNSVSSLNSAHNMARMDHLGTDNELGNINQLYRTNHFASLNSENGVDVIPLKEQTYGTNYNDAIFTGGNYSGVNLIDANYNGAHLIDANYNDPNLIGVSSNGSIYNASNLSDAKFMDVIYNGSNLNGVNFHPFPMEEFPSMRHYKRGAQNFGEREKEFAKLRLVNSDMNMGIHSNEIHSHRHPSDQLQAIVCLQKLEEIPTPFLNLNDIKYAVSVYFNSYDDILEKYRSKFYNCKLNESNTYANCDLKNEIINLPFNNEEFIYLKVIESSVYKTEITGRLQLKVKSLSQEYPLRIPIIGDDGNSKGYLIMNFFVTSSYYDVKNDTLITDRSSLPNRTKSTRIRRKNNGFHFFENFTKWCCEITDHHIN